MTDPAVKPKKPIYKRWWFIALVVIVGIAILANLGGGDGGEAAPTAPAPAGETKSANADENKAEPSEEAETQEPAPATTAGIGDSVTSGDLSLVVKSVAEPTMRLGDSNFGTDAQGEFIVVELEITNDGNQAENFHSGQVVLKSGEREFEPDGTAALYLPQNSAMLFDKINPGNTLKGAVVFDLPAGTPLETLEFRGSLFGQPAVVALS